MWSEGDRMQKEAGERFAERGGRFEKARKTIVPLSRLADECAGPDRRRRAIRPNPILSACGEPGAVWAGRHGAKHHADILHILHGNRM